MKRLMHFVFSVLIVVLILSFLSDVSFAKSKKSWLNDLPGRPGRAYLSKEVYLHSSTEYPGVNVSSPIIKVIAKDDEWISLPAKSSSAISGLAGIVFSTSTLDGATSTWADSAWTDPKVPRTLFTIWDSTSEVWNNVTITGIDARGNTISEVVLATAAVQTQTNNAFSMVTSVALGALNTTGDGGTANRFHLGTGDKIGLLGDITATSYFYKGTVDGTDETSGFTVEIIYDTWVHSDIPDGSDNYRLFYKCDSETNPR